MDSGIEFNFSFAPGITNDQIIGVELAGEMWANYLDDTQNIIHKHEVVDTKSTVINIHVGIGSELLPENVIGGSFPAISDKYKYEKVYDALNKDITTSEDVLATDSLLDAKKTNVLVNGEAIKNEKMQLTTANLKALDLLDSYSEDGLELDGYILMSDLSNFDSVEWNYDYLGGVKEGTLDFLSTITHEIGHTLGFISGTDRGVLTSEALEYYQNAASINIIEQGKLIKEHNFYTAKLNDDDASNDDSNSYYKNYFKLGKDAYRDRGKFNKTKEKFSQAIDLLHNSSNSLDAKSAHEAFKSIGDYLKYNEEWKDFIKEDEIFKETKDNLDPKKLAARMTVLDLFRYSNESSDLGANELTRGSSSYFSLDGSETDLAMSNGQDYQGSHWQNREKTEGLGIMNPTVALNERWEISSNDLMAMDAIGWDVNYGEALDMQALYNKAVDAADSALIVNRQDDVNEILEGDAYERRRSRSSPTIYRMTTDGYFSTFSRSDVTVAQDADSEILARIDDWIVVNNNTEQAEANNIVRVPKIASLLNSAKSVEQVMADYLEIDRPDSESSLLQEIRESLETGLEIAIATQTL